jgi:DHA2 family multidrug resistance protein
MKLTNFQVAVFTIIAITGAFMAVMDTTIVDIVVPKLTGVLSTDMYGVQWIITAYMLSAAVSLLISPFLIHNFGKHKIFLFGLSVFTLASFMCGISNSLEFIVFSRVLQGFAEALVMVSAHIMIFSYFPPHKKGIAMGIFALGVAFAPAIGPTLGGYLVEYFSWRMVFFINVPIGVITVIAGMLLLSEDEIRPVGLNVYSLTFLSISTLALLILLSKGQQYGWFGSDYILFLAFVSVVSFLIFVYIEIISKQRLVNYSLFKHKDFTLGILIYLVILGFSMYQYFYLLPVFYEHIKGLGSLRAGIGIFGFGVFIGIFSIISGIISDKYSPKIVILVGVIIYLIDTMFFIPHINYYTPFIKAVIYTIPFGIAMGMFFAPVTVLVMNAANNQNEQATMIMDYARFVGGSFGTAIATNNLEFYKNDMFLKMNENQTYWYVEDFIRHLPFPQDISKIIFGKYEMLMAANYGFYNVFLAAGLWGVLGSVFVFLLFVKNRRFAYS